MEATATKGNKKFWQGHVAEENGDWFTQTSYWHEIKDGLSVVQFSTPSKVIGKNIGRSNETTPKQQAYSELETLVNKQVDRGYCKQGEVREAYPLPMLCQKYKDVSHRLSGQLCVQPKLDGTRQVYDGEVMWTRAGKLTIPKVYQHLHFDTHGYTVDGELLLPAPYSFQDTMRATKKYRAESSKLQYWVFDIMDAKGVVSFRYRHALLKTIFESCSNPDIILVPTYTIECLDDVMVYQDRFVSEGYEGIIVRMLEGKYTPGHKSHEMQKFKYFLDDEYEIIGVTDGKGKNEGIAKFVCQTIEGKEFSADYNGTVEERAEMFQHPEKCIGKMLSVRYQENSEDGIPRFPKGINIRDYDVQGG
jgi:DNA ligase-1